MMGEEIQSLTKAKAESTRVKKKPRWEKISKRMIVRTDTPNNHDPRPEASHSAINHHVPNTQFKPELLNQSGSRPEGSHPSLDSIGTGVMIGTATAAVSIVAAYHRGEQTITEAARGIGRASVVSGTKSASVTALSNTTKHVLFRGGARHLARSHAPIIIAATIIDAVVNIYKDIKRCRAGEITKLKVFYNAVLHLIRSATKTIAAVVGGTVGAYYATGQESWVAMVYATLGATIAYIAVTKSINLVAKIWNFLSTHNSRVE